MLCCVVFVFACMGGCEVSICSSFPKELHLSGNIGGTFAFLGVSTDIISLDKELILSQLPHSTHAGI